MAGQAEKVFVALGNDLQDGIKTLEWTLRKWNSHQISIVILHLPFNTPMDFVYTPFGKLPASSVNDDKLEALNKYEKEKMDKLLFEYISFCSGKVKVELLKVDKRDEPIYKIIVDLISANRITKLVMGFTFFKSSSWKIKNAISGSFYIHKHRPDFCELFVICGGKVVSLRGENKKGIMENDQGVMVAKLRERNSFKGWLGKMFIENPSNSLERSTLLSLSSSSALHSPSSQNQWETQMQEIEIYFNHLLSMNLDEEEEEDCGQENEDSQTCPMEAEHADSDLNAAEKMESLKAKIKEAKKTIQLKKNEAKASTERHTKAERAIFLSNRHAEELQARIEEEVSNRTELEKELDAEKEHIHEVMSDIEESKKRLNSIKEVQSELSKKLHISTMAKSQAEAQVEKAVKKRADMVREIEELRQQRGVLRRRIEFCREKDAIGMVARLGEPSCGFKVYTAEEIRLATNGFSEHLRLKPGGDWTTVYRGRIENSTVAIKMLNSVHGLSEEDFQAKVVMLLSHIRHPHLVAVLGFCIELKCIVYEYMHNGSLRDIFLRDILHSSHRDSKNKKIRTLHWHDRVRVAAQVCSGLVYLHLMKPSPIVHGHLTLSNILLDRNLVAKINGFGLARNCDEHSFRSDIRAFGVLVMHLLTGRNWTGLVEAMAMDRAAVVRDLDGMAGQWPLDLGEKLAGLALRCLYSNRGPNSDLNMETVMEELNELKKKADEEVVGREGSKAETDRDRDRDRDRDIDREESSEDVPSFLLCPILKDVMKNPHVAADGFSYELEAIEEWLGMGHNTSPMTNLRLNNTYLAPNHALLSLIQDWHNKTSISTAL